MYCSGNLTFCPFSEKFKFTRVLQLQSHIYEKIKDFLNELRTKEMIQKKLGCLNYSSNFIKDLDKERQELQKLLTKKNQA